MSRSILATFLSIAVLLLLVGCGGSGLPADIQVNPDTTQAQPPQQEADARVLYDQITSGMSYDEVMQIMAGASAFMSDEGEVDTPAGKITTQTVSWRVGRALLVVIFENGKVISKDLTQMP